MLQACRRTKQKTDVNFCIFERFSGNFFVKFSQQNKIVMGQKILVPCFDVYNDRPFPEEYTVKDYIFNTKLEKGDHYYIQTRHKDFFPITILF